MVKRVAAIVILVLLLVAFFPIVTLIAERDSVSPLGTAYLREAGAQFGVANVVTAVVVTYRGFDTLGEVTVLFAASTGAAAVLAGVARRRAEMDRTTSSTHTSNAVGAPASARSSAHGHGDPSELVQTGAGLLAPVITVLGIFVFVHGHLTPGGGFQGGVIAASAFLLLMLGGRASHLPHGVFGAIESVAGFAYVAVGLLGLWLAAGFLDPRILPNGELGRLFSGGAVPLIYAVVGIKVGAELAALLDTMRGRA